MTHEEKIKLARQVMQISGIFTLVVAALLLINFVQLKKYEPLESQTLNTLVAQLEEDPRNEQLKEEIRDFDMMVRKAYFTSTWQVRTGALLMLIGGVLFAGSLKVYTDLRRRIGVPDTAKEDFLKARMTAWKWLLATGILVLGMAFFAAFSSTNYLENYYPEAIAGTGPSTMDETIEVIEIVDPADTSASGALAGAIQDTATGEPGQDTGADDSAQAGDGQTTAAQQAVPVEKIHGLAEFKKHHNSFRGPMALGVSYHKNIPTSWDGGAGTNVAWKVAISKPGYNSPVIWGDKLFLAGADEEARIVSCYDRHSGQLLWEKKADNIPGSPSTMPKVTDDTGLSAPTAVVDGYRVYAIFATGDVIAFDFEGNRVWARNLGVPQNHYGHSSSLLVWNGKVIVQYDTGKSGRMLALDTKTGASVWDISRDNHISWASPILVDYAGKIQVVTNTDPTVGGYDVETGEEIWKVDVMMGEVGPSCAYADGLVYANNEYASLVAINPEPGAAVQWESYDYLSEAASPVAYNGLLYLATSYGVLVCYDAKAGEQVWEMDFGTTLYSSPMVVDGKLYIMGNDGVMHIVKADRSGTLIGEPVLGEPSYAIPAFAGGKIYIRGSESLYCIGE
ncbi:MAG: PQQ-binding-like beta-propeller repeat protein [Bacteroidales bacterium]|nr:PQQ-binding-like beta-propeller repeat protein [Bacteroidales bacterium]MDT8430467.1 PQQ-binding-like beta-propeller repeat protein [Bacteroidales bacterium]